MLRRLAAIAYDLMLLFAVLFFVTIILIPGLFLGATRLGERIAPRAPFPAVSPRLASQEGVRRFAPALVPLGLAAWAAFSLAFILANVSYVFPVLSDPVALGWDLLGTASLPWTPIGGPLAMWALVAIVLAGLAWSSRHVRAVADELAGGVRMALPVWGFSFIVAAGLLWVLVA